MFPKKPSFICRRCGYIYSIDELDFPLITVWSRFECPNCRYEVTESGIYGFFKFYPRLVNSEQQLSSNGIKLIGYSFRNDVMGFGLYILLKGKMKFKCGECNYSWEIDSDADTLIYRENPKTFKCPHCYLSPRPIKTTKEFFVSLNQVNDSSVKLTHVHWDIFSPIDVTPPVKNIQFKMYRDELKI
jgi:hypothetical protein